ncbi:MAG: hypothetical protein ACOYOT_03260 [Bacteroidales bacterium]
MKKYAIVVLLLLTTVISNSQELATNPPSETGFIDALKTITSVNRFDLYTGTVSINIPLYEYKDQDFSIPISIQYASSGYKTYDLLGCVGLGWKLNTGGFIQRKINGVPDEANTFCSNDPIDKNGHVYQSSNTNGFKFWSSSSGGHTFMERLNNGQVIHNNGTKDYSFGAETKFKDPIYNETSPDLFTFNFLGHTGKFMMNESGTLSVYETSKPEGEYQIDFLSFGDTYPNDKVKIRITTGDGFKYTFEDNSTEYSNAVSLWMASPLYKAPATYFPLTEIEAPNGRKVQFIYNAKEWNTTSSFYFSKNSDWNSDGVGTSDGISNGYLTRNDIEYPITKIVIDNTTINFTYSDRNNEILDRPNTIKGTNTSSLYVTRKLRGITVSTISQTTPMRTIGFYYVYGKDDGYKFSRNVHLLESVDISGMGTYSMKYIDQDKAFPPLLYGRDYWGYWNNTGVVSGMPSTTNDLTTNIETLNDQTYNSNFSTTLRGMISKLTYPTGGYTKYYYEPHDYGLKLVKDLRNGKQNQSYLESVNNEIAGGARIKRVTNYANAADSVFTDFIYRDPTTPNTSSGTLLHTPRFYREVNYSYTVGGQSQRTRRVSWLNDYIASEDGVNVAYSKVKKVFSDGSSTLYTYSDYNMFPDLPHNNGITFKKFDFATSDMAYPNNFFAKNDSRHRIRGKLLAQQDYSKDNILVHSEEYKYDFDRFNRDLTESEKTTYPYPLPAESNIYTVGEAFSYFYIQKIYTRSCPLIGVTKTMYDGIGVPTKEETTLSYNNLGQLINSVITLEKGKTKSIKTRYPYDLRSTSGFQNVYDNMYDNRFVSLPIKTQTSIENSGIVQLSLNNYTNIGLNGKVIYKLSETKLADLSHPIVAPDFSPIIDGYLYTDKSFKYDSKGSLQQVSYKNGTSKTYIWGYNYQYPIAEISNATIEEVKTALGTDLESFASSLNPNIYLLDGLRSKLPNAQVKIYRYKPLIGLTSISDERNTSSKYIYDSDGKLVITRDNNQNILKGYKYNYQNTPTTNTSNYSALAATITKSGSNYYLNNDLATVSVEGGSGYFGYSWYLKNSTGSTLQSSINSNDYSFPFVCTEVGLLTLVCEIKDLMTNNMISTSKPLTYTYVPLSGDVVFDTNNFFAHSLSGSGGLTARASLVNLTGGSASKYYSWTLFDYSTGATISQLTTGNATATFDFICPEVKSYKVQCVVVDNGANTSLTINKLITTK